MTQTITFWCFRCYNRTFFCNYFIIFIQIANWQFKLFFKFFILALVSLFCNFIIFLFFEYDIFIRTGFSVKLSFSSFAHDVKKKKNLALRVREYVKKKLEKYNYLSGIYYLVIYASTTSY